MDSLYKSLCRFSSGLALFSLGWLIYSPLYAIEPTPPIVFAEPMAGEKTFALIIDSTQVSDIELSVVVFQDGDIRAEEALDYSRLDVRSLDAFPRPNEVFHLQEQKENAGGDRTTASFNPNRVALAEAAAPSFKAEPLRELRLDRQKLLARLRGGVDLQSSTQEPREEVIAFLIPVELDVLKKQKDGYYAVSYQVSASLRSDPNAKRFENQQWLWFQVQDQEVRSLSLARYSQKVDPVIAEIDPLSGQEIQVYVGRSGLEDIPLEKTEKFKAIAVEIVSGAEREDSGAVKDRKAELSEADER